MSQIALWVRMVHHEHDLPYTRRRHIFPDEALAIVPSHPEKRSRQHVEEIDPLSRSMGQLVRPPIRYIRWAIPQVGVVAGVRRARVWRRSDDGADHPQLLCCNGVKPRPFQDQRNGARRLLQRQSQRAGRRPLGIPLLLRRVTPFDEKHCRISLWSRISVARGRIGIE